MSKVAIPIISCSCDEQKLKKLFHLEHSHIRNDDDFDDDDDAMGHGVCQIMMFVDGGGWGSGKTQNKMTSFMNSALFMICISVKPSFLVIIDICAIYLLFPEHFPTVTPFPSVHCSSRTSSHHSSL